MAYNYKLGYYNWSRITKTAPIYDERLFSTYGQALKFLDEKVKEFTDNLRTDVRIIGECWDGANSHNETTVYDYRCEPITAHIWIESIDVSEYEL